MIALECCRCVLQIETNLEEIKKINKNEEIKTALLDSIQINTIRKHWVAQGKQNNKGLKIKVKKKEWNWHE